LSLQSLAGLSCCGVADDGQISLIRPHLLGQLRA
jgi:hypothetical protein